ncbi:MAG: MOSC domain-containing protein [Burkholderiales bacterium]|nr:MOSC domain-containing protein [Burkholderiales bacterium]
MPVSVSSIYRYPVKGLSPEFLARVTLAPGECLPHDRRFALARAATQFDPAHPAWLPKSNFFMLMRDEVLAQLRTRFDEASGMLTVERDGKTVLRSRLTDAAECSTINAFFAEFLKDAPGNPPRVVEAPGHTFSDAKQKPNATTYKYVSFVNLASIEALEKVMQVPVDPLRFRANVYMSGLPAWNERDWVGSEIRAGNARLRVVSPITRCAATSVNPATAERDLNIPAILQKEFGHNCMGVYAEVVAGGEVAKNDRVGRTDNAWRIE